MGRSEPCVLFAQTFVHPQLDEYVDEVIFAEPVVVNACEFLEQNASSGSPTVTLVGATSPPSFALEVFVQSEGETRFRRLCQPFLYSHSSSNVLEVEAVVTNHLVVRGSYRSLTLVIYGNTAEDLGQFNIDVDIDSSLTNVVCSTEGRLEDLPPALVPTKLAIEESISPLKTLCLKADILDISVEIKQFLLLTFRILELSNLGEAVNEVVNHVVSAASSYATDSLHCGALSQKHFTKGGSGNLGESCDFFSGARKELMEICKSLQHESGNSSADFLAESMFIESDNDLITSKQLVDILRQHFPFHENSGIVGHRRLSQKIILWLNAALLLCSSRESCFHFVNGGGMEQLGDIFCHSMGNSSAVKLLLLGVVELATRHSIGCEGFLGWWPREDENVPSGISKGYNQLLKLLLQKQRHDVASIATYALQRLRFYEVASRYESAVLSVLGGLSAADKVTSVTLDMLTSAKIQLKNLLKLINTRGPIEDPSPLACASRSLVVGGAEGLLSYKATSSLITSSYCCFSNWDVDPHLLSLLKERGFLPLSAALLSSSILRSEAGHARAIFVDIASHIEAIILSLLFCRPGLIFLLLHPELSTTVILALRGADGLNKEQTVPLRYASVLISKGFFCRPWDVGTIVETHLRAVNALDRLLTPTRQPDENLWVLWELCALSRSDCGRQALLGLGHFPEAVSILMEALHSTKESDTVSLNSGASSLDLAIFHSAAEIFELIVTDSTASSLGSWIEHATELHKALHSSSAGSNRKDAPTRLLEWIDAAVVYQRNGSNGLLRYAAVLASGGDAHIASTSILASDVVDVENVIGDSSSSSDSNLIENLLRKPISEKAFPGVILRDSSVAQLTTSFRILAFISENSAVADALYDEGAMFVIHGVLIDCRLMLERFSNNYDYLVDEGTECNSTSDLLLERNREQSLVDLLVPSLVLLINLLQRLQEAKEPHRNTKLMNALLQLHREVSPKLAACAADLTASYPDSALGFEAVCHLIVSALSCWPVYGWTPGLFRFLLDSLHSTSLLALGPKETFSLLCLLNDLFPEEGVRLWNNGMPMLTALRTLAVGTLLGPQKERQVNWYLKPEHSETLLNHLTPQLEKIAQIILHYATSTLAVVQDLLRVFIVRIACLKADNASLLLRPIILSITECLSEQSLLSDTDAYKVYRLLDFLASLLEHSLAKPILMDEGAVRMLTDVLETSVGAINSDGMEGRNTAKCGFTQLSWCIPVFKSFSLICGSRTSVPCHGMSDRHNCKTLTAEDCALILSSLLQLCKVLPVGSELLACLSVLKELVSCNEGRAALLSIFSRIQASSVEECESESRHKSDRDYSLLNAYEWSKHPPLLCCWTNLSSFIESKDFLPLYAVESVGTLSSSALLFCMDGKRLNFDRVVALKYLFGLPYDANCSDAFHEENLKHIQDLTALLSSKINDYEFSAESDTITILHRVKESAMSLLFLLQKPIDSLKADDIITSVVPWSPSNVLVSSKMHKMADYSTEKAEDYDLGGLADKFMWECPENLRERLSQASLPVKRKMSSLDGANRRPRGENAQVETTSQSAFSRGSGPPAAPLGPTRRDTFRQRKPNTSRPPSMHVDDYVARERNVDGSTNSNVIAIPRVGPTGGRPPSIHVDEFMARQRERQNTVGVAVGDATTQVKNAASENEADADKSNKSRPLKPDPDDDLQGIDIVFDGEESESDDKLPFPQPDDNLQQPASVIVEQSSPRSIVEETESDVNGSSRFSHLGAPVASNVGENTQSEFSSRMSVSRPEMPLTREPSISSDRRYSEQPDDVKNIPVKTSGGFDSASSVQSPFDSRMPLPNFYPKNSSQQTGIVPLGTGSQGPYDRKFQMNQPPLPPMPPPPTVVSVLSQTPDAVPSQSSPFVNSMADMHHVQSDYLSALSSSSSSLPFAGPMSDSKYARTSLSSPGGPNRPPPPLPPTPPPYSANPSTLPSLKTSSQSSVYNQSSTGMTDPILTSYPPPPLMPPLLFGRPASIAMNLYGGSPTPHQGENPPSISQNFPIPLPSIQSIQSLGQLQPLQPPQLPRPPQPPQHLRPPIPASPHSEQGGPLLQNPVQMQVQPLQMLQQPQVSQIHAYYQTHQQENFLHAQQQQQQQLQLQQVEHTPPQSLHQLGDGASQQEQDPGMSLQHFFSSPEAIQSLLSDRDKLCQLLEQHPKLMQMLQERLGQL